jgi:membrane protein YdbS with pleckstrin-like domain
MDPSDGTDEAPGPEQEAAVAGDATRAGSGAASDRPLGPDAASILATEHWSLLASRSLVWNEAMSRTTLFLTVLSASIIALALLADATGFGSETSTVALVLLPVVLLLGIATYVRLVRINTEEFQLVLAMNRLRHGYLAIEPGLEPYFTTGHHDDEQGLARTYLLGSENRLHFWGHFLIASPTIVATIDAALAAAIAVLVAQAADAPTAVAVAASAVAFLVVWGALFVLQLSNVVVLRSNSVRFPTPPDGS